MARVVGEKEICYSQNVIWMTFGFGRELSELGYTIAVDMQWTATVIVATT